MTRTARAAGLIVLMVSCSSPTPVEDFRSAPSGSPSASITDPTPSPSPSNADAFLPEPDARLPQRAPRLAAALERVHTALLGSVSDWVQTGDPGVHPVPRDVVLQALYEQRVYRLMMRRARLGDDTLHLLSGPLARRARETVVAGRSLRSLVTPVEPPVEMKTQRPEPAGDLMRYYEKAERRFDIDWEVLASINMVETRFGRIRSSSSAGAQGPMQFLPSTWDAYGMGGDINDPHDSILAAANYLRASGAPADYPRALYAYNHADEYVDAVLLHARWMRREPNRFYAFYNWQVFVITTEGDQRMTGPGL